MKPLWILLISVLLYSIALGASLYGNEIDPKLKLSLMIIGSVLPIILNYWQLYLPLINIKTRQRNHLVENLLYALIMKYREVENGAINIRVNVMLVNSKFSSRRRKYLEFSVSYGSYSDAELEQEYNSGVGCSGTALQENNVVVFDSVDVRKPYRSLSATQRLVTEHIKSIVSVPFYRASDSARLSPIGMVNVDSSDPIQKTRFDDDNLQALIIQFADLTGVLYS